MATRTNRVLEITTRVRDRMTGPIKAARIALKLLRTTAIGVFRAIGVAARLAGRAIRAMLGPIGLLITALAGFGLVKLLRVGVLVEDRVREIATLLPGLGGDAIEKLSRDIRAAAVEGGQSFQDEFKAAYDAISAGVAPERLLKFIRTANKLAVGGATDVGTATDLLTGTLNAFGANASEAERFADALFTTVKKGKTTIRELAEGIGQVSSIAAAAGLSIEETGAAMAALTLSLGDTNLASTQLKASLSVLVKLSDKQRAAAKSIADGLDLSLSALREKGIVRFLEEFNEKTEGSLDVIAKIIPNIRAVSGLTILAADGGRQFADAMDQMRSNVGAADEAFKTMAAGSGFAFRRLRSAIADVAVELANGFLPPLVEAAEAIADFLTENREGFREFADSVVSNITFVVRAIGPLRDAIRDIFTNEAEAKTLGTIFLDLAQFALDVAKETAVAVVKIIIETVKLQFRNVLTVVGILAEQAGRRFVAAFKNELKLIAIIPLEIGREISDTLGTKLTAAVKVAFPGFGALLSFADSDIEAIKDTIRSGIDAGAAAAEEGILSAEATIGAIAQGIAANLGESLITSGSAIKTAIDNMKASFEGLEERLGTLGEESPAITSFLAALEAIRAEMGGLDEDVEQAGDAMVAMFNAANKAAEQARRNALGIGTGRPAIPTGGADATGRMAELAANFDQFLQGINSGIDAFFANLETPIQAGVRLVTELGGALESSFNSAIDSAVEGTFNLGDALKDLGKSALKIFAQIAAKQAALAITRLIFGGFGAEAGGVVPGHLTPINRRFQAFAAGGITRGPTLALLGEGKEREAVVPLPDGRSIPVMLTDKTGEDAGLSINNFFQFEVMDARGVRQVLQAEAETIRNVVAAGIQQRRDFRGQVRG